MKRNFLFLILAMSAVVAFSQSQNPIWVLKGNYLKFSNVSPYSPSPAITLPGGITQSSNYANARNDASGNPLFFIIDGYVYSGSGGYIGNFYYGYDLLPAGEIVVVPDPGNCKRYYIIYACQGWYDTYDLFYSQLDVTTPGSFYLVTFNGYNTAKYLASSPDHGWITLAASKLRTDITRFVFASGLPGGLYRYTISTTGFNMTPFIITPNTGNINWGGPNSNSELELWEPSSGSQPPVEEGDPQDTPGQGGFRVAGVGLDIQIGRYIWEMELDANGDFVDGTWVYHSTMSNLIHGLEFSPNGNYLYYTHELDANFTDQVEYLDLPNGGGSVPLISSWMGYSNLQFAEIELGADQKLYFAVSNRLARLDNPNSPSSNNYTDNANLGTPGSYILPDQIDGENYYANQSSHLTGEFTTSYRCDNNVLSITVTSTESLVMSQNWYLYQNNTYIGQSYGLNPTSWIFDNVLPNTTYLVIHLVTDYCNVTRRKDHNVYTEMPGIDPSFQLTHTAIQPDHSYGLTGTCSLPSYASFYWKVEELDGSGNTIPGTVMENPYWWWSDPNSCDYPGYCCDTSYTTTPGVFYTGHRYKITHGTWSNCNPWASMAIIYQINEGGGGGDDDVFVISTIATDTPDLSGSISTRFEDFDIFPNPASDLLTIRSGVPEEMTYTVTNMLGKVMIPVIYSYGGLSMQLDVSKLGAGIYLIRNNKGYTKKFVIQR